MVAGEKGSQWQNRLIVIINLLLFNRMKNKYLAFLILPLFLFGFLSLSMGISEVSASPDPNVWVCKYSGTPDVNEFLKPGKNPIVVSSNATVGEYFNDAHGRSYVLALQTDENTGSGNSYIGELSCPEGDVPTPEIQNLNLTFMQPCQPIEGVPTQAEWRVRNPNDFSVDYTVDKAGTGEILSDEAPSGDSFFYTIWGAQTLILKWEGGQKTKAGGDSYNGTMCEVEKPVWTLFKTVGKQCVKIEEETYAKAIYTITIQNEGTGDGEITNIVDELDSKVLEAYIENISDSGEYDNGELIWEFETGLEIASGNSKQFTYTILIPEEAYGTYENTAIAYSSSVETNDIRTLKLEEVLSETNEEVARDSVTEDLECEIVVEDDEPEVLGTTDEVKDTPTDEAVLGVSTVVLAETGASDNILVYVVQAVLMLATLISGTLFVKKYII